MKYIIIAWAIWNLLTFSLMGIDKRKAIKGYYRISERTLLTCSFLMGGVGTFCGALVWHHKTKKTKFQVGIPLSIIVNLIMAVIIADLFVIGSMSYSNVYKYNGSDFTASFGGERNNDLRECLNELNPECAIVLGCAVYEDGTPCPMLRDRLDTGIALYETGLVPKILLSGDNGQEEYNEIHAMLSYCIDKGIPNEDIFCDHAGFSTYDSIYRAQSVFGVKRAVIVTQKYHEYRALYIADRKGMEAVGVSAAQERYKGFFFRELREIAARDKDMIKTALNLKSRYGGDKIPINGDGRESHGE